MSQQRAIEASTQQEIVNLATTPATKFWGYIARFAEARWLRANGWIQVRDGWLLPDWHPHLRRFWNAKPPNFADPPLWSRWGTDTPRAAITDLKEPYDQTHALNSQRVHTNRRAVQISPRSEHKAPAFPPYLRQWAWMPAVQAAGFLTVSTMLAVGDHSSRHLFFLASVLIFCVAFYLGHRARKEWELDWAESRLDRRRPDGVHRPN